MFPNTCITHLHWIRIAGLHSRTSRVLLGIALPGHLLFTCILYLCNKSRTSIFTVQFPILYAVAVVLQVCSLVCSLFTHSSIHRTVVKYIRNMQYSKLYYLIFNVTLCFSHRLAARHPSVSRALAHASPVEVRPRPRRLRHPIPCVASRCLTSIQFVSFAFSFEYCSNCSAHSVYYSRTFE